MSKPALPSNPGTWPREYTQAWSWLGEQGPPRCAQGGFRELEGPGLGVGWGRACWHPGQERNSCEGTGAGTPGRWVHGQVAVAEAWHRSPASGKMTR